MQEAKKLRSGIKAETFHPICPRVKFPTPEVLEGPRPKPQTFFSSGSWSSSSTVARAASASRAECRCAECNLTAEGFVCWGLFCSGFIYLLCCFCVCGVLCFALFYLLLVLACSFCLFVLAHGLLSCVSAVFVVCSSGLWGGWGGEGGGLITSSLHTSHGTACEFLGIYRLWRVSSLKVVVFDGGSILCGSP